MHDVNYKRYFDQLCYITMFCYTLLVRTPEMLHHPQEQRRGRRGWRERWASFYWIEFLGKVYSWFLMLNGVKLVDRHLFSGFMSSNWQNRGFLKIFFFYKFAVFKWFCGQYNLFSTLNFEQFPWEIISWEIVFIYFIFQIILSIVIWIAEKGEDGKEASCGGNRTEAM